MTENEFVRSIGDSWEAAKVVGVDDSFTQPTSLTPTEEFKNICRDPEVLYEDIFLSGLKTACYNIILKDHSYLQYSMSKGDEFRFAYYPNPFIGASPEAVKDLSDFRDMLGEGDITLEDYLHMVSEVRRSQHAPLLRYENAPSQYKELHHPCSHFHFGHHGGNRWPVKRILTPYVFSLIILKLFYADSWIGGGFLKKGSKYFSLDELYNAGKDACTLLPLHLFSNKERKQFYLS